MKPQVTVCDVCKDLLRPVRIYRVSEHVRTAITIRCDEHGVDFEAVLTRKRRPARRGGRRTRVVSMAEVERAKKQR